MAGLPEDRPEGLDSPWALRFINLFNNRPEYSPKPAVGTAYTQYPVRG